MCTSRYQPSSLNHPVPPRTGSVERRCWCGCGRSVNNNAYVLHYYYDSVYRTTRTQSTLHSLSLAVLRTSYSLACCVGLFIGHLGATLASLWPFTKPLSHSLLQLSTLLGALFVNGISVPSLRQDSRSKSNSHPPGIACAPRSTVLLLPYASAAIGISIAVVFPILPCCSPKRKPL